MPRPAVGLAAAATRSGTTSGTASVTSPPSRSAGSSRTRSCPDRRRRGCPRWTGRGGRAARRPDRPLARRPSRGLRPPRRLLRRPASVPRAPRARRPPRRVAGHIGLKLYHCSGAAPIVASRAVGDRLGRPGDVGVGRGRDRDQGRERHVEHAVGAAPDRDRQDQRLRLGRERGGPGRQRRPRSEHPDRNAVGAIAPVDQEGEHLAVLEDRIDLAQVLPRDHVDAVGLAQAAEALEHLGKARVVGDDVDRPAPVGDAGGDRLVVADVAEGEDQPAARRRLPGRLDLVEVGLDDPADGLGHRQRLEAHDLDEVGRVLAIGAQGQPPDTPIIGRQPGHAPEVRVRPGPLRRPEQVARLAARPDHPARQAGRDVGDEPDRRPVRGDRGLLDDPGTLLAPPMRSLEALAVAAALALALARGHQRADAAAAFLPAAVATGAVDASFLSCAFVRFSVPTSVSLSSPRMNASRRLCEMSSWIWIGGLFMK